MFDSMSNKLRNKLRRRQRAVPHFVKKRHCRKSIEWHKRRILARLNPRVNKGQSIVIHQNATFEKRSVVVIRITDRHGHSNTHFLRRNAVQEHHRIIQALRYLTDEGKIESNMITKEWDIQLALGTAESRTFKRKDG